MTPPLAAFVPPTATHVTVLLAGRTNTSLAVSSSPQTLGNTGNVDTNPSECFISTVEGRSQAVEIALNGGTNIFVGAANTGAWSLSVVGWKDKVNAN